MTLLIDPYWMQPSLTVHRRWPWAEAMAFAARKAAATGRRQKVFRMQAGWWSVKSMGDLAAKG